MITVPAARPAGADAEAIAPWYLLGILDLGVHSPREAASADRGERSVRVVPVDEEEDARLRCRDAAGRERHRRGGHVLVLRAQVAVECDRGQSVSRSVRPCAELPGALSLTETEAERAPDAVGLNVTEIVQLAPAASVLGAIGHVFVCAKSAAFAPVRPIELIVSAPVPEFVRVTFCAGLVVPTSRLPKARLVGESVTAGAGATPVPLSATAVRASGRVVGDGDRSGSRPRGSRAEGRRDRAARSRRERARAERTVAELDEVAGVGAADPDARDHERRVPGVQQASSSGRRSRFRRADCRR